MLIFLNVKPNFVCFFIFHSECKNFISPGEPPEICRRTAVEHAFLIIKKIIDSKFLKHQLKGKHSAVSNQIGCQRIVKRRRKRPRSGEGTEYMIRHASSVRSRTGDNADDVDYYRIYDMRVRLISMSFPKYMTEGRA